MKNQLLFPSPSGLSAPRSSKKTQAAVCLLEKTGVFSLKAPGVLQCAIPEDVLPTNEDPMPSRGVKAQEALEWVLFRLSLYLGFCKNFLNFSNNLTRRVMRLDQIT